MGETLLGRLAGFAESTRDHGIPPEVGDDITARVLDVVGNAVGAIGGEGHQAVSRVALAWGGTPEASAIGVGAAKMPAPSAALVNGTLAHSLDFDDTHLPSVLHPSASVIPAVLAVAQSLRSSGAEVRAAAAIGDEICVRLGAASYDPTLRNSIFFENGLHATSICGTIASAAAAAVLYGLDTAQIGHAMSIAASMGAGLLEANRTGGSVKQIHCGWAAHAGVTAASLAREGLTGPPTVLEGRFGFFRAYSEGRYDEQALVGDLGDRWETLRIHFKPYPANHFTHPAIDAAIGLRERGVDPREIAGLQLGVAVPTLRTIAEPADIKARPATSHAAKFSAPYVLASALVGGGGLGVCQEDFSPAALQDPERLRIAGLVRCFGDDEATTIFPNAFQAVLRATLRDGSIVEQRVEHNRGGPDRPLSRDELTAKFRMNVEPHLAPDAAEALAEGIWGLGSLDDLTAVMDLAAGAVR